MKVKRGNCIARMRVRNRRSDRVIIALDDGEYAIGLLPEGQDSGEVELETTFSLELLQDIAMMALTGNPKIRTVADGIAGVVLAAGIVISTVNAGATGAPDQEIDS